MRQGKVFVNAEFAGVLTEHDDRHFSFDYDEHYLSGSAPVPVCLSMPVNTKHYESEYLFPFFSNLLSEGDNREFQARYLGLDKNDDFGILLQAAAYDTIGNVTVIPVIS